MARNMFVATFLAIVVAGGAVPVARAQEATPQAGEVVPAAECQIAARDFTSLRQMIGTPVAGATPDVAATARPNGEEADQATVDAVTATYRELVACINAGDFLRVYSLYTEEYVRRLLEEGEVDLELLLEATPTPPEAQQQTALLSVTDVRRLEGDYVSAQVSTTNPLVEGPVVIDAILVRAGDRYLIDQETVVEAPSATPE